MSTSHPVVLVAPIRTAIGTFGGSLKDVSAPDLGALAIGASVKRAGLEPGEIGTVIMGNVIQAGAKMNPARQAAVHAGLPVSVPAMTVNRVCGSGAQAIVSAAQEILLGNVDVAVAGGMENMDQAPYLIAHGRWGYRMGDGQLAPPPRWSWRIKGGRKSAGSSRWRVSFPMASQPSSLGCSASARSRRFVRRSPAPAGRSATWIESRSTRRSQRSRSP